MKRCSCGAQWRVNYPHGRKSKVVRHFVVPHDKRCRHSPAWRKANRHLLRRKPNNKKLLHKNQKRGKRP